MKNIIITVFIILFIIGAMYFVDRDRMRNNEPVLFSTWGMDYAPPVGIEENNEKEVVISHSEIKNISLLDEFLDNTNKYNENRISDEVKISTFTIEGDEIITKISYSNDKGEYQITRDNTKDKFANEEDRQITINTYNDDIYHLEKKIKDDYIYLILEASDYSNEDIKLQYKNVNICAYNKSLEKNKDTDRVKVNDVSLIAKDVTVDKLVRYNGILYGQSNAVIDYARNENGPIGIINKLIGEEYLPTLEGETNSEELLNALVDDANGKSLILIYNNEAVLYTAIEEK